MIRNSQLKGYLGRKVGATRRVRAMYYRGFSSATIASLAGLDQNVVQLIAEGNEDVTDQEFAAIRSAFIHTLSLETPKGSSAKQAQAKATRNGWSPFGAWADIDDPDCEPETIIDPATEDVIDKVRTLIAMGFTLKDVADRSNTSTSQISVVVNGKTVRKLRQATVDKITKAFEEMSREPRPEGDIAERTRNLAREKGWHELLEWVH